MIQPVIQHYELKRTSAIKVTTTKITDDFHYEWKPSMSTTKLTLHSEQNTKKAITVL